MQQVLILHGWSDRSESFRPLAARLRANGYEAVPLWLGDYLSMFDEVSIPDVAKRMEEVMAELVAANKVQPPFDMIVHSTGGLVARTWLTMFDTARPTRWLQRLVMLAPANHGSRLASLGKSMLGRLTKGLDNWFQTGTGMLNALELGSPFQWQLALTDVLHDGSAAAAPVPYSERGCLPFVITGVKGYDSLFRRPLNEDGADGTVRAAAANLTSHGLTLDFTASPSQMATPWSARGPLESFAFCILADADHASIVDGGASVLPLVLQALRCPMDSAAYLAIRQAWHESNEQVADVKDPTRHQFFQLNTFVVDDLGQPVPDHFIEFHGSAAAKRDEGLAVFQSDVIEHVHVNQVNGACRTFYIDRTDLFHKFYAAKETGRPRELLISVWATQPGPHVTYFNPAVEGGGSGQYRVHLADDSLGDDRWLRRHCTHFLKVVIPRRPMKEVFQLNAFDA